MEEPTLQPEQQLLQQQPPQQKKEKSQRYKFSKREIGLMIIIGLAVVGVTIFAWQTDENKKSEINSFASCVAAGNPVMESYPEQCAANGQTFVKEKENYTDSAGVFSITYPTTLRLQLDEDCCEGEPKDWSQLSRPFNLHPLSEDEIKSSLRVDAGKTDPMNTSYRQNWVDGGHKVEQISINGYLADTVRKVFDGDAEEYADREYLITHEGNTVFMSYREYHRHEMSGTNYDAADFLDDYESVVQSVNFL